MAEVDRFIKLQHRSLRRLHDHRSPRRLICYRWIGQEDEGAGHEIDAAVRQRVILFKEQPHATALQHNRFVALPGACGENFAEARQPCGRPSANSRSFFRRGLEGNLGPGRPLNQRHHRQTVEAGSGQREQEHTERTSESVFHGGCFPLADESRNYRGAFGPQEAWPEW